MSDVKHTAGEWSAASDPMHFDSRTDVADAEGGLIASMCGVRPERTVFEMEANARLVSAAPDLLEALKAMADYYGHQLVDSDFPTEAANMRAALAAIAKASGETP